MQTVGLGDLEGLISHDPRFSAVKDVFGLSGNIGSPSIEDEDMEEESETKKGEKVIDVSENTVRDMMEDDGESEGDDAL